MQASGEQRSQSRLDPLMLGQQGTTTKPWIRDTNMPMVPIARLVVELNLGLRKCFAKMPMQRLV
jgi:hypothetical protein